MPIIAMIISALNNMSLKNILIASASVVIISLLFYFHHVTIKNEDAKIEIKTNEHLIKIKGKQDEIRNSIFSGHSIAVLMRIDKF